MRYWTTGEIAKQRDISVRTLRYYDQIQLLTPSVKEADGTRLYTEDDLFRLEKIMILKSISLPLKDIRNILDQLSYKQVLTSHYNYLQDQAKALEIRISKTTSLMNMMEFEESLSWERVTEVVRNSEKNAKKWLDYFSEDQQVLLEHAVPSLGNNDETTRQYMELLKQIEKCIANDIKPESETGQELVSQLNALSNETFHGDEALMDQFWEVRKQPVEETGLYPISEGVLQFVEQAMDYTFDSIKSK